MRLFLASESPRRRELLKRIVTEFAVEGAAVRELTAADGVPVAELPVRNAALKAAAVAVRHPCDWVLGADTVVVLDGVIYGKPRDLAQASEFLRHFSGRVHEVLTGVSLQQACSQRQIGFTVTTEVRFKVLTESVIAHYLTEVPVLDKAGAYGIQDHGDMLVEGIVGELENVIGLPMAELRARLVTLGVISPTDSHCRGEA